MENLPIFISIAFAVITALTIWIFFKASHKSPMVLIILLAWMAIQTIISLQGFYLDTSHMPPRFALTIGPPLLFIIILFSSRRGRAAIQKLDIKWLTMIHAIRIPVELVLFGLFIYKAIPRIMTFEGNNFDIIAGISALVVFYLLRRKFNPSLLLAWNIIGLCLLINIVVIAVLSAPFNFQQIAFDQPNIAVLYFPFTWLPSIVVPLVLLSHLAAIFKLVRIKRQARKAINAGFAG